MRKVRSGSHLEQRGDTWYYRRVVPQDVRDAFGKRNQRVSLGTTSRAEAMRLEKKHDVDFESRLQVARTTGPDGYPKNRDARIKLFREKIFKGSRWGEWRNRRPEIPHADPLEVQFAFMSLNIVASLMEGSVDQFWSKKLRELLARRVYDNPKICEELTAKFDKLFTNYFLENTFDPTIEYDPREWSEATYEELTKLVELLTNYHENTSEPTIDWAYEEWLKAKNRPRQTQDEARRYIDEFKKSAHLYTLAAIRRRHVADWRDKLRGAGHLGPKSINHRLEIVSAILRTGWREAEIPAPDLERVNVPEPVESGRTSWSRDELLRALQALEPRSWSAWVFVIALTTGTRLGEPVAAMREWYEPTGCISVPAQCTKMKKPHVLPIIELIRGPLVDHISRVPAGAYMFNAPRPAREGLKISHEVSKWFSRFFDRQKIDKVFHELRHTWVQAARESPIKKEIYEIISGHAGTTGSDPYGGAKPSELVAANETVCRQFLNPEMTMAVRRLVG